MTKNAQYMCQVQVQVTKLSTKHKGMPNIIHHATRICIYFQLIYFGNSRMEWAIILKKKNKKSE